MIIDTSVIVAIFSREDDAAYLEEKVVNSWPRRMSVACLLEATMVLEGKAGPSVSFALDALLVRFGIELVPITLEQTEAARVAWRRFGKGNHPARLNFGDCFSYALARTTGEPLLFKGNDFAQTDIEPA